jgi:L-ascorbate metabolism protein UlaG (beta-lactamase superfamily)
MKIKWNGHASFTITADNGTVIVTDPYNSGKYGDEFTYNIVRDRADGVLVSHEHADHSYVKGLTGSPKVLTDSGDICGIVVTGFKTFHDEAGGKKRGPNMSFRFSVDGVTMCFLGDLGHILSPDQIKAIGSVDLLFIPVGGTYTIDGHRAATLVKMMNPRVAIPMHFKTKKCNFPITGVDEFLSGMDNFKKLQRSEIDLSIERLPEKGPEVWVLDHAC